MATPVLLAVAAVSLVAAYVWARSARRRLRLLRRLQGSFYALDPSDVERMESALVLARGAARRETHNVVLYLLIALASVVLAAADTVDSAVVLVLLVGPAIASFTWARTFTVEARLSEERFELERRAEEALAQEDLAPRAWAARLAPELVPDFAGFEVGRVYQAGSGLMAGDFFDIFKVGPTRLAAVIGDVAGHGIESSITAFQAKYLLRVFLQQFRDPAQALEELNEQMSAADRREEFISLVVVVFDTKAGTLRFASAGHPTAWLWHEREVQPLRATGPLLMLDPKASYVSREIPLETGDLVLMYTDGLAEVRNGSELFGEDRVALQIRRDPGMAPGVLCKTLIEAARDFSDGPIQDDVAIMAIRRS